MLGPDSPGVLVPPGVNGRLSAPTDETVSCLVFSIFNFRYDEWIKADKIVRPANKNVPKIKHRKKIKVRALPGGNVSRGGGVIGRH